ncbi:MAG: PAS domain-containing protein [Salinivirgaceae bacterium]|nr:PAS domain-containing protein [Salinivirgaceae bacterium]
MNTFDYYKEFASAVTICDVEGMIIYMNDKAALTFEKWGGKDLVGKSLFNCHNPKSRSIIQEIIKTGMSNTYTIDKNGEKKMIHQAPWFKDGIVAGVIEMSIVLPNNMPHYQR